MIAEERKLYTWSYRQAADKALLTQLLFELELTGPVYCRSFEFGMELIREKSSKGVCYLSMSDMQAAIEAFSAGFGSITT